MSILADLRYAARRLRQRPGLLVTSLVTLALGIGFNALVFGFVDSFLLKPLHIAEPDRVVNLTFGQKQYPNVSYPNYIDIRDRNQVFSDVAAERIQPMALSGATRNARLWGYEVTGNYFRLLGIRPLRGRFLEPSDDLKAGAGPVAVISYGCWRQKFGADPGVVGRTIRLDGHPFTVVGITPPGFRGTERWYPSDIWVPLSMVRALEHRDWRDSRSTGNIWVIARLKPATGRARVEASLRVLASQMALEHPDFNDGFRMGIAPPGLLGATLRGPFVGIGTALLLVSGLTLLVACANLSGLVLAHASARQKEIAIRYAIGAGRGAILRMMLSESLLIALGGSVLGFLTGVVLAGVIEASRPLLEFPIDTSFGMDWRVAGFAVALSLASAVVFGLLPGLRASRVDLAPALKSGAGSGLSRHWTLRDVFVGVQVAFCMVLVAGALMMVKTLRTTLAKNFGFDPAGAVTLRFDLAMQGYSKERGVEFQSRLLDRVRALPGVQAAGLADRLPLSLDSSSANVSIEGAPAAPLARLPVVSSYECGPDFFRSLGARIVAGRDFNEQDKEGAPQVAIVNQIFAEKLLAGRDPLANRFRFGTNGEWVRIVGVVEAREGPDDYRRPGTRPLDSSRAGQFRRAGAGGTVPLRRFEPARIGSARRGGAGPRHFHLRSQNAPPAHGCATDAAALDHHRPDRDGRRGSVPGSTRAVWHSVLHHRATDSGDWDSAGTGCPGPSRSGACSHKNYCCSFFGRHARRHSFDSRDPASGQSALRSGRCYGATLCRRRAYRCLSDGIRNAHSARLAGGSGHRSTTGVEKEMLTV
jgi:predicted permease